MKILSKKDPVPLDLLLRSNLVQQELSRMIKNSLSLLDKTVQVTPQVMRMLGRLLEIEVTRDDPELAAAMASLTVSEKKKITPSRRQHKENERDCRTIVQQLVSSIPQNVVTSISYKRKEQGNGTQKKTVTFEDQDQRGEVVEQNLGQEKLSGETNGEESMRVQVQHSGQESLSEESDVEEKDPDEEQDLEDKILPGEFRWMNRTHRTDPEEGTCSIADSSIDDSSRNSGIDTYSDRNSSSGSELSELAIHTLLVETRAKDLDRDVYQDPDSDCYFIPSERVFDNASDHLETIAVSKRSIRLLPQKEVVRTDLQPFEQEKQLLAKVWCVKMEVNTHQPYEMNSQIRIMRTYLKARYRLSDLRRAQRNDHMTSNLRKRFNKKIAGAKAYSVGDYVWVLQNVIPPKGTRKLRKKWRGPFMITEVHQEGRFCRLSTGRAAHCENIKQPNPSKEDWCIPADMEEWDYLMMDPACEVNEKGTRGNNDGNEVVEEGSSPPLDLGPVIEADEETLP